MEERWEYMTEFLMAELNGQGVKEYLKQRFPGFEPAKHSPQTMIPRLNHLGEAGWELVHMQPVLLIGSNQDVFWANDSQKFGHTYFCVFKRRLK